MFDPAFWEAALRAEWAVIYGAPYSFAAVVLVGWLLGWLVIRAWYKRSIKIGEGRIALLETECGIEKRQKEGLRQAILELKPEAKVLALEISHGDPEIRSVVASLAQGGKVTVPADLSKSPVQLTNPSYSSDELKRIAQLIYTSANDLSRVVNINQTSSTSAGTSIATGIVDVIKLSTKGDR
jgi:hypothetical protein